MEEHVTIRLDETYQTVQVFGPSRTGEGGGDLHSLAASSCKGEIISRHEGHQNLIITSWHINFTTHTGSITEVHKLFLLKLSHTLNPQFT